MTHGKLECGHRLKKTTCYLHPHVNTDSFRFSASCLLTNLLCIPFSKWEHKIACWPSGQWCADTWVWQEWQKYLIALVRQNTVEPLCIYAKTVRYKVRKIFDGI